MMAVIAVLAIIGTPQFLRAQKRARDATRKNDLAQIKRALELAKQDGTLKGLYYPCNTIVDSNRLYCTGATNPLWPGFGQAWTPYIPIIPRDPRNVTPYVYKYSLHKDDWSNCDAAPSAVPNCPRFRLYTQLEDANDPTDSPSQTKCGVASPVNDRFMICSD